MIRFLWAFVRRDLRNQLGDPVGQLARLFGAALLIAAVVLLSRAYGGASPAGPGASLAYLLTGIALADLFHALAVAPAEAVWQASLLGALETMLSSPRSLAAVTLGEAFVRLAGALARAAVLLALVPLLDGGELSPRLVLAPLLALTVLCFFGVGLWITAGTVVVRRAGLVGRAVAGLAILGGGVFFPVETLPGWLPQVARLSPLTAASDGLRAALLDGLAPGSANDALVHLALASPVLLGAGLVLLAVVEHRARRSGSLLIR